MTSTDTPRHAYTWTYTQHSLTLMFTCQHPMNMSTSLHSLICLSVFFRLFFLFLVMFLSSFLSIRLFLFFLSVFSRLLALSFPPPLFLPFSPDRLRCRRSVGTRVWRRAVCGDVARDVPSDCGSHASTSLPSGGCHQHLHPQPDAGAVTRAPWVAARQFDADTGSGVGSSGQTCHRQLSSHPFSEMFCSSGTR